MRQRQADHHPDVIALPLHALCLLAEKGGAHLPCKLPLGEPDRLTLWPDGDQQLVADTGGIIVSAGNAFVSFQRLLDLPNEAVFHLGVRPAHLDSQGLDSIFATPAAAVPGNPERLHVRHFTDELRPPRGDLGVFRARLRAQAGIHHPHGDESLLGIHSSAVWPAPGGCQHIGDQ